MLALALCHIVDHAVVHGPHIVLPLGILRILHMLQLTILKGLHSNPFHCVAIRHKLTGIHQLFNLALPDFLDDDMLLGLR